jgi:hypothetical protein
MMSTGEPSSDRPRVTLSGDRDGDYVVVEEHDDGSLVLELDPAPTRRTSRPFGGLRLRRPESTATLPQTLHQLGVRLERAEAVREFRLGELDGVPGFGLVTDRRFQFIATSTTSPHPIVDRRLTELREATLTDRVRGARVDLHWSDHTQQVLSGRRDELARLQPALTTRPSPLSS